MNPGLAALQPYPFERLRALTANVSRADVSPLTLTIGEPQHAPPPDVIEALSRALDGVSRYPLTASSDALRGAIARWLEARFGLEHVDSSAQVLPVNGTREALFAIAQVLVSPGSPGQVIAPNPFYQIYEGAALLAGTKPRFVGVSAENGFLPDFSALTADDWQACELLYLCTPGNPAGAVIPEAQLQALIRLAEEYDFMIASDECYSEIYPDEAQPPVGILQAAHAMGNTDFKHCLAFHSLSKRSSLPGLRSGFVAGDADVLKQFLRYRTYHGCAMPPHHQVASIHAWSDETHVVANRALYREKFDRVLPILEPVLAVARPEAGFYLWPETAGDDEAFAVHLLEQCNVSVLPGRYLGRDVDGVNPGAGRARLALVAELEQCVEAAHRIADCLCRG
ncbi:succinyldiaminopimelate transaminase [Luminiphilus syltensis NOR5-1B]|uniref:Succinyldiaminopimelate transaminase n=1 Tax=Luminiphilus syltensis NOR5-1B TaxID=565045 RepID=B8KYA4_9GAMM|nr:succinyldiaminopimelate transaminase [Luminiphilus syltensis]EED34467.1 succinyldiaminopimelate transaminase [Luminiphilus syltensis NOR5-1B]